MLRVGIVGCGKIADSHAALINQINGAKLVGACDRELLMAQQLSERFGPLETFTQLADLLSRAKPDVVHITTPPQSHFDAAKLCIEAGCHVYVEKPFTLNETEARCLVDFATAKSVKLTVGHDNQFRRAAVRMRELIQNGYLGGMPVHMESYFCYELKPADYAGVLLSDKKHWVRSLPGQLLHNIISHGVARVAEFLVGDSPQVVTLGFVSNLLAQMGETELVDELRVVIKDINNGTAYFTFSSQMKPSLHQFRIYGPDNGLAVDQDQETVIKLPGTRKKSFLEQFVSPAETGIEYFGNSWENVRAFLRSDFHPKAGLKHLIELFYNSIRDDGPVPIPYREILLTARIMDEIFAGISRSRVKPRHSTMINIVSNTAMLG